MLLGSCLLTDVVYRNQTHEAEETEDNLSDSAETTDIETKAIKS